MADSFDFVFGWRCPLCRSTSHESVWVRRPSGAQYRTEFYECSGCTAMFRHPGRFTRLGRTLRRWAGDIEPVSLSRALGEKNFGAAPRSLWIRNMKRRSR